MKYRYRTKIKSNLGAVYNVYFTECSDNSLTSHTSRNELKSEYQCILLFMLIQFVGIILFNLRRENLG